MHPEIGAIAPEPFKVGPTPSTIAAVKSQLQASGLTVTNVARDGLILDFEAPNGLLQPPGRRSTELPTESSQSFGMWRAS